MHILGVKQFISSRDDRKQNDFRAQARKVHPNSRFRETRLAFIRRVMMASAKS